MDMARCRHRFVVALSALLLPACQLQSLKEGVVQERVGHEIARAAQAQPKAPPEFVSNALLPPITIEMPAPPKPTEPRFDLSVNKAPASEVLMAMVSGTRYSMLVHPDVKEPLSINLKNVTLTEALDAIRELYGYEYKIDGTRVYVMPIALQSRLFQVNYLAGRRVGRADVRVSSGSIQAPATGAPGQPLPGVAPAPGQATTPMAATASLSTESSRVTTSSDNDFWADVQSSIRAITGTEGGRTIVVNSNAGVIMVRALPKELRAVEQYLRAMSLMVERQVMLEAKILEVTLSDQYATGINWTAFGGGSNSRFGLGVAGPGTVLRSDGSLSNSVITIDPSASRPQSPDPLNSTVAGSVGSLSRRLATPATGAASILGLAFQSSNFAALLNFLESQGRVHVLSSPRIATLNNQKAVLKVGTDEFFVTNISTTTVSTGTSTSVSPTITTQPFFSGIALDVTPQISDEDLITLHIHPSVSSVTDKTKILDLGTLGTFQLPLASSQINESDTIVRVQDGTIAAIGGLMRQQQTTNRAGAPGTTDSAVLGNIFGSRNQDVTKSELVILLKVTVIKGDAAWQAQAQEINERLQDMRNEPVRVR